MTSTKQPLAYVITYSTQVCWHRYQDGDSYVQLPNMQDILVSGTHASRQADARCV